MSSTPPTSHNSPSTHNQPPSIPHRNAISQQRLWEVVLKNMSLHCGVQSVELFCGIHPCVFSPAVCYKSYLLMKNYLYCPLWTDVHLAGLLKNRCQMHNGPEGWVHLAKVTSWSHNRSSSINLDHISFSESRLSINKKSQPKSASPQNLKLKILTKPSFRISTKIQLHNLYKTSSAKCWINSGLKSPLNINF